MVEWYQDGYFDGYRRIGGGYVGDNVQPFGLIGMGDSGATQAYNYKFATNGVAVDANIPTRSQIKINWPSSTTLEGQPLESAGYFRFRKGEAGGSSANPDSPFKRYFFAAAFVVSDADYRATYPNDTVPTPYKIALTCYAYKKGFGFRSTNKIDIPAIPGGDNATIERSFNIPTVFPTDLEPGTKYWVAFAPMSCEQRNWNKADFVRNMGQYASQLSNNNIGDRTRALSFWSGRAPLAPVINTPLDGVLVAGGATIDLSISTNHPDAIAFATGDYRPWEFRDLAGVEVQYAARPTPEDPSPVWMSLPSSSTNTTPVVGPGWWIENALQSSDTVGVRALRDALTIPVRCGANTLTAGTLALPSGDWQIRVRTFKYGHPNTARINGFSWREGWGPLGTGRTNGVAPNPAPSRSYTPETYPASLKSPWSKPVNVSVAAQVPPPTLMSPINQTAVTVEQPVRLEWQYRNTALPPYAQKTRLVQIRKQGETNWSTLVSGNSAAPFYVIPATYGLIAGTSYEWRVQVTDTTDTASNFSSIGRFWAVPRPVSGPQRGTAPEFIDGATLGIGTYRVFVYRRGGKRRVAELTGISKMDWGRTRDDISTASVVINEWDIDKGNLLAGLKTWAYELVIVRDNGYSTDRVWEGPITLLTYEEDKVSIDAKDVMAFAYRRIIKQALNDNRVGDSVVSRALRVLQNCFAPDDPNVLAYMNPIANEGDARQYRSLPPYSRTGFEEVDDMAANAGLDYTVVGRSILLWGTKYRIGTLPEMRDDDLGAAPIVSEYGMSMANRYVVSDGNGIWGAATRLNAEGKDSTYGLVEMLSSTWAQDAAEDTGTYTQEGIATMVKSFEEYAERSISDRYPPPVVVRVPDNTTLNPSTVLNIQQLVPGVVIPLRSRGTLRTVKANQKLDSVKVTVESGKETIAITMSPFNRDDAEAVEGEG